MLGVLYCQQGHGFPNEVAKLIGNHTKTLYVGMKSMISGRRSWWVLNDVTYCNIYHLDHSLDNFELVIVELFAFNIKCRRDKRLVEYLTSSVKPNILIRHCKGVDVLIQAVYTELNKAKGLN